MKWNNIDSSTDDSFPGTEPGLLIKWDAYNRDEEGQEARGEEAEEDGVRHQGRGLSSHAGGAVASIVGWHLLQALGE